MRLKHIMPIALLLMLSLVIFVASCDERLVNNNKINVTGLEITPSMVYANNDNSFATIKAFVHDNNGFAVQGQEVTFRSDVQGSTMIFKVTTDSSGVATTIFKAGRNPFILPTDTLRTARIEAFIGKNSIYKNITIRRTPSIGSIEIDTLATMLSVMQTLAIKAKVFDNDGNEAPDGTQVTFKTSDAGYFSDEAATVQETQYIAPTKNGVVNVIFNASTVAKTTRISAWVNTTSSGNKTIRILPGSPKILEYNLTSEQINNVMVNSSPINVPVKLTDMYSNSITNKSITFATTKGNISTSANTNEMGIATAIFTPGAVAGDAEITATADSATKKITIPIKSTQVSSIRFSNTNQIDINVQGANGVESAPIEVKLYDMNNNLISSDVDSEGNPIQVKFKLLYYPQGAYISGPQGADSIAVVNSYGGVASVSINSGTLSGVVTLQASLVSNSAIKAVRSNIIIHAGLPFNISFNIAGHNEGTAVGSGNWRVVVSAFITDKWGNPVEKGTAVHFLLPEMNGTASSWATIDASSSVGNESVEGDSAVGTAYSTLVYHGTHSNDSLLVRAETAQLNDETHLVMPMQTIRISAIPLPASVVWLNANTPPSQQTSIYVNVVDGQNNPIHNCHVSFTSTWGFFDIDADVPSDPYDNNLNTGCTDNTGNLIKQVRYLKAAVPDPQGAPATQTDQVNVDCLGVSQNSGQCTVTLIRYV